MRSAGFLGALVACTLAAIPARAACQLAEIGELPVTMVGLRPTTVAKIDGEAVRFLVDSGAFYSVISASSAAALHLQTSPMMKGYTVSGVGGEAQASVTTVKRFTLGDAVIRHVEFFVLGFEAGSAVVGMLGQNLLSVGDVEYDLAHGVIRLLQPMDCGAKDLAYWVRGQDHSAMPIDWGEPLRPHTIGTVIVDGVKIRALFDTGAETSILSTHAAARAGIKLDAPGVVAGGYSRGIGRRSVRTWIAPVTSFAIGGEEVRNARLRIGDIGLTNADMLIGADFFLSHHVYVSNSQHRLFFTYNGGPVFNLDPMADAAPPPASAER